MAPAGSKAAASKPLFRASRGTVQAPASSSGEKRPANAIVAYGDCPLIGRLPKLVKTGDWAEDARRESVRDDFVELLNVLWNEQDLINPCVGYMRKLRTRSTHTGDMFDTHPGTLGKVEKEWLVRWLCTKHSSLKAEWFDTIDCNDRDFAHEFASAALNMPLSTPLPPQLQVMKILSWFLDWRVAEVGRLAKMVEHIDPEGGFERTKGGPFHLSWSSDADNGYCTHITHISGVKVNVPDYIRVTRDWALTNWYSDSSAALQRHPAAIVLKDFFSKDSGPNAGLLSKKDLWAKAAALQREFDMAVSVGRMTGGTATVLKKSREATKTKLADKARQTLAKHREFKKKKSQIILT